jgi:hypothetical protein
VHGQRTLDVGRLTRTLPPAPTSVPAAPIDQIRLTITDPSSTTPDIARVDEVAAH